MGKWGSTLPCVAYPLGPAGIGGGALHGAWDLNRTVRRCDLAVSYVQVRREVEFPKKYCVICKAQKTSC
jgi:hypothetical protein